MTRQNNEMADHTSFTEQQQFKSARESCNMTAPPEHTTSVVGRGGQLTSPPASHEAQINLHD